VLSKLIVGRELRPDHDQQEGRQQQPDDPDPRKTFPLKSIKDILQLKIIN